MIFILQGDGKESEQHLASIDMKRLSLLLVFALAGLSFPDRRKLLCFMGITLLACSCNSNELIFTHLPPKIILDNPSGVYTTKPGRAITIAPAYESAAQASFSWTVAGRIVGTEPSYTFTSERVGQTYIELRVTTDYGTDEETLRVDVLDFEIPVVSVAGAAEGYIIGVGKELILKASVLECSIETHYAWLLDGEPVGEALEYVFVPRTTGTRMLCFKAWNRDGEDSVNCRVTVKREEELPFWWRFEQTVYYMASGNSVLLGPAATGNDAGIAYRWSVDGEVVEGATEKDWLFDRTSQGVYTVVLTAQGKRADSLFVVSQPLTVTVSEVAGTYYRPKGDGSRADWTRVYAYRPAPGQFINECKTAGFDGTQTTSAAAIAYAESRMQAGRWVSLGGFGGYIVVGFDHSIDNGGDYDFAVIGNSFEVSSEPGIVYVMQDENGDGQPNETWYELRGCETGNAGTLQHYALTYYRPAAAGMAVQWKDNYGRSGEIRYLKSLHDQGSYYPLWMEADSYTLRGTCLEARNYDPLGNGNYWVLPPYEWGYADNFSPAGANCDRLADQAPVCGATADEDVPRANFFKISRAMRYDGSPANLQYIDFIKVQTGVNAQCGRVGEMSTEVSGFYDCHIKKD